MRKSLERNYRIRPVTERDLSAIGTIAEATELFPASMLNDMIAGYIAKQTRDIWFVCEHEGAIASFGFCEPERATEGTWNLLAIGVDPAFQGRGVGAAMMAYIESELQKQAARILLVETMGTPAFERTRAFYRACGYVEEARIREFYELGGDKVVFWKRL